MYITPAVGIADMIILDTMARKMTWIGIDITRVVQPEHFWVFALSLMLINTANNTTNFRTALIVVTAVLTLTLRNFWPPNAIEW